MPALSRRDFVVRAGALAVGTKAALAMSKLSAGNLGVQLYTVRNIIGSDPLTVLQAIQSMGYTEVEVTYDNLDKLWGPLQSTKLKPVSIHVPTAIFRAGGAHLEEVLSDLQKKGFQYVVVPYIAPNERGGADTFKSLAGTLNIAGARAKHYGMSLCYHNHAFEFEPMNGTTGMEIMMKETQKGIVSLELDIFWATVAGHNPVELLKTYSGRIPLLHLKDEAPGLATQYNEKVPPTTFKEIGNGSINISEVLAAADKEGVKHYFVEQDQSPDPIISLRQSFGYLKSQF